ncbi:P27 family phage terminase small subunit [Blastococcus sp. TBT05-19]|uniref:P27 family phage terminase small subunit n=1 Tax=Blastococcus sp. TBT05-19 TaxID=2250581 RepID=UPI0011BDE8E7|nr:P27 family phage terminase small subunit [Blastococcus sp. TBT05-19]
MTTAEQPADWTPAFPGQRPPFQPGHTLSLRHGVYSDRRIEPLAQQFVDAYAADPSVTWLTTADGPALHALGRAEAKVQLLEEYLGKLAEAEETDLADLEAKRVEAAYRELHRAETRAMSLRTQLGFTPMSRARLGRNVAAARVDMAELLSRMQEAQDAAQRVPSERSGEGA